MSVVPWRWSPCLGVDHNDPCVSLVGPYLPEEVVSVMREDLPYALKAFAAIQHPGREEGNFIST